MIAKIVAPVISFVADIIFVVFMVSWSLVVMAPRIFFGDTEKVRAFQAWSLNFWGHVTCNLFRVKINVHGRENLPKGGGLVLFNHQSLLDIVILQTITGRIKFGAKIELFKVPFFGPAMRLSGMLPIARDNIQDVIRVYKEAESRAARGELFALAPEGTRQKQDQLGLFKSGPFIFAINAKLPIHPIVIRGVQPILKKGSLLPNYDVWSRSVDVHILPPVMATDYTVEQKVELMNFVRSRMAVYFDRVL